MVKPYSDSSPRTSKPSASANASLKYSASVATSYIVEAALSSITSIVMFLLPACACGLNFIYRPKKMATAAIRAMTPAIIFLLFLFVVSMFFSPLFLFV